MRSFRTLFAVALGVAALATVTACKMDTDEMVMNPSTRDEIITRLLEETVAKQNIMNRLTTADDSKMELAETLLGDTKVKGLAVEKLTADTTQRKEIIQHLMADPAAKGALIDALLADQASRDLIAETIKKPLPKPPPPKKP